MSANIQTGGTSKSMFWVGWILSGLPSAFLLLDGVMKLLKPDFVVKASAEMGYRENVIIPLGIVVLASTILYLIPRTAVVGAILLTGYLGGAVATHVRAEDGLFPIIFPVIFGAFLWGGLCLRDERLSALIFRRSY